MCCAVTNASQAGAASWQVHLNLPDSFHRALQHNPDRYRRALYACLSDPDLEVVAAALRVLGAMLLSRSADPDVLDSVGAWTHPWTDRGRPLSLQLRCPIAPYPCSLAFTDKAKPLVQQSHNHPMTIDGC